MATSPCRANRRRSNRPVLTFLLLTCVAATPTAIVHADALEEVLAAWHARHDKVRSATTARGRKTPGSLGLSPRRTFLASSAGFIGQKSAGMSCNSCLRQCLESLQP